MAQDRGRFVWHELMTMDPADSIRFYQDVIGWSIHTMPMPGLEGGYTMIASGSGPETSIGGIAKLTEDIAALGARPHWLGYVAVADVDAAAKRVQELGGQVKHAPTDIPTVGRFAVIADPQGAILALFHPDHEGPAPAAPGPRQFSWMELASTDPVAALAFYADLFGWTAGPAHDMGHMGVYQLIHRDGLEIGGMFLKPAEMPGPPCWIYYISLTGLEAALARVVAGGGTVINGPLEVPGGDHIAQCLDPHGVLFALHEQKG